MAKGHIKLGAVGDVREYMLSDHRQYIRSNANQMAGKLGTGAGDYGDLQSWTAWAMDNWEAGIGKKDPEAGGSLYAEVETRWPNQIVLPPALIPATQADPDNYELNTGYAPGVLKPETTIPVGTTQTVQYIAKRITGNGTKLIGVLLLLQNDDDLLTINVQLATSTGVAPNIIPDNGLATVAEVVDFIAGLGNHYVPFNTTLTDNTDYFIILTPTIAGETMTVALDTSSEDITLDGMVYWNGSAWVAYSGGRILIEPIMGMPTIDKDVTNILYFPATGFIYAASDTALWKKETDEDVWEAVGMAFAAAITDLHTDGDTLYIGLGDSNDFQTMDNTEAFTGGGDPGRLFTRWNGFLWRVVGNDVYYTGDGVTWTGPIEVCPQGFLINGIAGQQDYMFVACDDGLYYVGFGDQVLSVTQWGQLNPTEKFGTGMLNWQGALYIPIAQGIIRYDASTMLPVGPDLGEGLPIFRSGNVTALATQNNWLFCVVRAAAGQSTVWAYNGQGWHFVTLAPSADLLYFTSVFYRRDNRRLYLGTNTGAIFYCTVTDTPNFSDLDALTYTSPYGFWESDIFYGGLRDVDKDMESVEILGENIDSNHPVRVYWQDDSSDGVWGYLGEITSSGQELRWDDYAVRPNTKGLKLGLGLYAQQTLYVEGTPVIRAVRVKFHNMVTDTWRWSFPIQVSSQQTMLDNELNDYTSAQMTAHLDLLAKQVAPVIFQDLDGTQYEAKIVDMSRQVDKIEYINGALTTSYIYRASLEQVTKDPYTP
jgi:hypothetical protein